MRQEDYSGFWPFPLQKNELIITRF